MPLDGSNYEQEDEVLDLLRRARERVAISGGWCQGVAYGIAGSNCLLAALQVEREYGFDLYPVIDLIVAEMPESWKLLADFGARRAALIVNYNDVPGRTQAEIVALFDRAIAMREGK